MIIKFILTIFVFFTISAHAESPKCVIDFQNLVQVNQSWHYGPSLQKMEDKSAKWISSTLLVSDAHDLMCRSFSQLGSKSIFSQSFHVPRKGYYYFEGIGDDKIKVYLKTMNKNNVVLESPAPIAYFNVPVELSHGPVKIIVELEDKWNYASGFILSISDKKGNIMMNSNENWVQEK